MMKTIFGIVTLLVGGVLLFLGFEMQSNVNWFLVAIGSVLSITGYKVIF